MKMKYNDFEQQWQALSDDLQSGRCPMTDAELDREVRRVLWSGEWRAESGEWEVEGVDCGGMCGGGGAAPGPARRC